MEQNQLLIIGGVAAVLILAVIIFIVLKNKNKTAEVEDDFTQPPKPTPQPAPKKEEPKPKPTVQEEPKKEAPSILKEEPKKEEPKPAPEVQTTKRELPKREKREVPAHGKITKDNFKEFAGTRVLVAEDNMINQKVIKGLLADSGIEIVIANDGQEAVDILAKDSNFEFVLMDAHMPNIDGFEATRIIRANPAYDHILVVALSGDTAADDIKKMQDAGMEEQLEKPLKMDALYDIFYAYTKPKEQPKDTQETKEVVEQKSEQKADDDKELDYEKGLETCGSDVGFYHEILAEFVQNYENAADRIDDLIIDEELKKVNELLHEILGVSANIGADKMHALTEEMKESIKATQGESYADYSEIYREKLDKLINEIKGYLK